MKSQKIKIAYAKQHKGFQLIGWFFDLSALFSLSLSLSLSLSHQPNLGKEVSDAVIPSQQTACLQRSHALAGFHKSCNGRVGARLAGENRGGGGGEGGGGGGGGEEGQQKKCQKTRKEEQEQEQEQEQEKEEKHLRVKAE